MVTTEGRESMTRTIRAAIYLRMSKDDQESGLGLDRQRQAVEHLARAKGWTIVPSWQIQETASASDRRKKRPGFERLLRGMAEGQFDAVLAYAVDRLVRGLDDLTRLIDTAEEYDVAVSTVSGDIDLSNAHGRGLAKLLGVVASIETDNMGERMRRRKLQNAQRGIVRAGGRRPYGFTANRSATVSEEVEIIREVSRRIIDGASLTSVVWDLNRRGVPTSYGGSWTLARLQNTLRRPTLAGRVTYKGEVLADDSGQLIRGEWEPILTDEQFDGLQIAMKARRRLPASNDNRRRHLLSGLMRCGKCGEAMLGFKSHGRWTYTCGPRRHLSRVQSPVDAHVVALVKQRAAETFFPVDSWADAETQQTRQEITALQQRRRDSALEFADGSLSADLLRTVVDRLDEKITGLESSLVGRAIEAQTLDAVTFDFDRFDDLPVAEQFAAIRIFVRRIVLKPAGRGARVFNPDLIEIEWRDLHDFRLAATVEG